MDPRNEKLPVVELEEDAVLRGEVPIVDERYGDMMAVGLPRDASLKRLEQAMDDIAVFKRGEAKRLATWMVVGQEVQKLSLTDLTIGRKQQGYAMVEKVYDYAKGVLDDPESLPEDKHHASELLLDAVKTHNKTDESVMLIMQGKVGNAKVNPSLLPPQFNVQINNASPGNVSMEAKPA